MSVLNDGTFKCDCVRQSPSVSAIPDVESVCAVLHFLCKSFSVYILLALDFGGESGV